MRWEELSKIIALSIGLLTIIHLGQQISKQS